ncbi:hypothetical protein DENSPDRAFT_837323 [Dentipellis sp. KUC8613]|nr:hypothetical protein DENSPDRAFT_837323 [Dentipellis sp. KUC8613]
MSLSTLVSVYPLIKLPFILGGGFAAYVAANPPNATPSKKEMSKYKSETLSQWFQSRAAVLCAMSPYFLTTLAESALTVAHTFPWHPLSHTILTTLTTPASPRLPPPYLAGLALLTLGALLRKSSFRHLGPLYTYQLSIRDTHTLVTFGPYAYVRHPGYLGAMLTFVGAGICMLGPGALLHDSGVLGAAVVLWLVVMAGALLARVPVEDAALRREFGEEWERWRRRVTWAVLPGVY